MTHPYGTPDGRDPFGQPLTQASTGVVAPALEDVGKGASGSRAWVSRGAAIALAITLTVVGAIAGAITSGAMHEGYESTAGDDVAPYVSESKSDELPVAVDAGASGSGTWDDPYTLGETVATADWTITLGTPTAASDGDFENPDEVREPESGTSFWVVPVDMTYAGDSLVDPGYDVTVDFRTSDDDAYGYDVCDTLVDDVKWNSDAIAPAHLVGTECVVRPEGSGRWSLDVEWAEPVYFTE